MNRRWRTSLLVWILVVSVLPVVPVMVFAGMVAARHLARLQQDLHASLPDRAVAAAAAVDSRLAVAAASLAVLANAQAATLGDLPTLKAHALRVVADQPDGAVIQLLSPAGVPVFSTADRPDTPADHARAGAWLTTGLVPTALPDPAGPRALLARQPVRIEGQPPHQLTLSVPSEVFTQMLQRMVWPEGWVAAVLDPQRIIVGRNRDAERFVGQPATASLSQALAAGQTGILDTRTQEGTRVLTAVAATSVSPWRVAVGAPRELLSAEYEHTVLVLAGGAAFSLGLAGLASLTLSRWLRGHVRGMLARASESEVDGPDSLGNASILELEPVSEALREAHVRERAQSGELDRARHDPLTGLATRAWLLKRARAERSGQQRAGDGAERSAVLFIDLDGFKEVNDRHGHERGDLVLAEVGACILDAVRGHDLAGRWGGDEFVVCVAAPPSLVTAIARAVAERIVQRVALLGDGIACSVGVAVDVDGQADVDTLIRHADAAMLAAKRAGKNQVVLSMH